MNKDVYFGYIKCSLISKNFIDTLNNVNIDELIFHHQRWIFYWSLLTQWMNFWERWNVNISNMNEEMISKEINHCVNNRDVILSKRHRDNGHIYVWQKIQVTHLQTINKDISNMNFGLFRVSLSFLVAFLIVSSYSGK